MRSHELAPRCRVFAEHPGSSVSWELGFWATEEASSPGGPHRLRLPGSFQLGEGENNAAEDDRSDNGNHWVYSYRHLSSFTTSSRNQTMVPGPSARWWVSRLGRTEQVPGSITGNLGTWPGLSAHVERHGCAGRASRCKQRIFHFLAPLRLAGSAVLVQSPTRPPARLTIRGSWISSARGTASKHLRNI